MTDGLRKQMNKRIAIFRAEGRSVRWKRLGRSIKETLEFRKGKYFDKESERLRKVGNSSKWYSILPKLDDEQAKQWTVNELEPDTDVEALAEKLAVHFTSITNESGPLLQSQIPTSRVPSVLIPQLLEKDVATRIKKYKKTYEYCPGRYTKNSSK